MTTTVIHLVRHAEVQNPDNIWYGHLEGFSLSARGRETAEAAAVEALNAAMLARIDRLLTERPPPARTLIVKIGLWPVPETSTTS